MLVGAHFEHPLFTLALAGRLCQQGRSDGLQLGLGRAGLSQRQLSEQTGAEKVESLVKDVDVCELVNMKLKLNYSFERHK